MTTPTVAAARPAAQPEPWRPQGRTAEPAQGDLRDRFARSLRNREEALDGKAADTPGETGEARPDGAPVAGFDAASQRHGNGGHGDGQAPQDGLATIGVAEGGRPAEILSAQAAGAPATGSADPAMQRMAAEIAFHARAGENTFVVELPGTDLMAARVEQAAGGHLSVTLQVRGSDPLHKRRLAQDLARHLQDRGWDESSVRLAQDVPGGSFPQGEQDGW